jgi:hypothetical protein
MRGFSAWKSEINQFEVLHCEYFEWIPWHYQYKAYSGTRASVVSLLPFGKIQEFKGGWTQGNDSEGISRRLCPPFFISKGHNILCWIVEMSS